MEGETSQGEYIGCVAAAGGVTGYSAADGLKDERDDVAGYEAEVEVFGREACVLGAEVGDYFGDLNVDCCAEEDWADGDAD